jgi:hypothetical protein
MNKRYSKFLKLINKMLYITSAAMLIAGVFLTASPQAAQASTSNCEDMQLNLSHISCVSNKVEIHFVLLNVPSGTTPGTLTFKVKVNGGTETTYTIASATKETGNVWHYYYYATVNGKYDITWAHVKVGSNYVDLHNPHDYKNDNQNCVATDLCTNLEGTQTTMPAGYEDPDHDKVCTLIPTDLCTNIPGTQTTMPPGWEDPDGDKHCSKIDLCSNIPGDQATMPAGYEDPDHDKVCTVIPVDLCTNLEGTQTTMPAGYEDLDHDKVCTVIPVYGCTDPKAKNYNASATVDDGSCTYDVYGCTDPTAKNYNASATVDDGSCTYDVYGCTDPKAKNYNASATVDDGSCTYDVYGCTDPKAKNYNASATVDDGSCTYDVYGCTDPAATNYNSAATVDDGSCTYPPKPVYGCTDPAATNYNSSATVDDGTCTYPPEPVYGCTDPAATNYNASATVDDGTCTYTEPTGGCTDPAATNYNAAATVDDGSCTYKKTTPKDPLKVVIDPFCNADGLMQWTVVNPNSVNITITHFTVDGVYHKGMSVLPGEHNLVATPLGTHTVVIFFNETDSASLTYTIAVCPLPIPVTGGEEEAVIPVTGADLTSKLGMGFGLGGISLVGLALLLSALRKMYHL